MQKEKIKGNKVYAMFADLKAAFDNVDRNTLWKILREGGIKGGLIKKVEEMYEGTEVTIRTKRGYTERFWTKKGVRQGCVMSPLLFNMAKVEGDFRKRKIGGIEVGKIRVWNLAYADDFVVIAKNRETLIDMIHLKDF